MVKIFLKGTVIDNEDRYKLRVYCFILNGTATMVE